MTFIIQVSIANFELQPKIWLFVASMTRTFPEWIDLSSTLRLLVFFKSVLWNLVHSQNGLVGFPHEHIFSFLLLSKHCHKHSHHGPHLSFAQGDLTSKVLRAVKLCGQNNVIIGTLRVCSRTETNLHLIGTRQERLRSPFRKFERIVLQFVRQDGTALRINSVTPTQRIV